METPRFVGGRFAAGIALISLSLALYACSSPKKDMYKDGRVAPPLEVPPDLLAPTQDSQFALPATLERDTGRQPDSGSNRISLARDGDVRWLIVPKSPERLWMPVHTFVLESGFAIAWEDPALGLIETEWLDMGESEVSVPEFLQRTLGAAGTVATRERFRIRLDRGAATGSSELFVSHRREVRSLTDSEAQWFPVPADSELEIEMLKRLMVYLGAPQADAARGLLEARRPAPGVRRLSGGGDGTMVLEHTLTSAWRRVGLALDRTGATLLGRDRAAGQYSVRTDGQALSVRLIGAGDATRVVVEPPGDAADALSDALLAQLQ